MFSILRKGSFIIIDGHFGSNLFSKIQSIDEALLVEYLLGPENRRFNFIIFDGIFIAGLSGVRVVLVCECDDFRVEIWSETIMVFSGFIWGVVDLWVFVVAGVIAGDAISGSVIGEMIASLDICDSFESGVEIEVLSLVGLEGVFNPAIAIGVDSERIFFFEL